MKEKEPSPVMSRRNFVRLVAVAGIGVTVAGGYTLAELAPWLDYDQQADYARKSLTKESGMPGQKLELVRYATLAANGHNAQPWKFTIKENTIEIHPDHTRHLAVVDPKDRELWISLGCALENLLIAARAMGYEPEVDYPDVTDFITIRLLNGSQQSDQLFKAIPLRQTTRSEYDGKPIRTGDLDQVQALQLEPGVSLRFITNQTDKKMVLEYVDKGNESQFADKAFIDELISWLRFNKKEALASSDGLFTRCSGNPEVPHWLGRMFVAGTKPQKQADLDVKKLRSSSGAVVIASELDNKTAWVRTGQVCERMMLKMTSLDIKSAFLNQPIEIPELRSQFRSAMGLGAYRPQLLVRFGYAGNMPRSLRRPVEQVMM